MTTTEIETKHRIQPRVSSPPSRDNLWHGNILPDEPLDGEFKHAAILMVDDEPINSKSVGKYLRSLGYENFTYTSDSSTALDLIRDGQPDLVLLDIMMPQVNGLDLLREMCAEPRLRYLPVIILTAYCDPETKCNALEAGATDFLGKPIEPHELAPRVRNVLATKWHQDQLARYVGQLEGEVRQQARELVVSRHEAKLRYLAGKAEIATDVLHNVGNALNSVNVDVDLISRKVDELRLESFKRACDLLEQHSGNLAEFLTNDKRGRALPSYFVELADALLEQRASVMTDIGLLNKHVEHINTIVATQQKYATLHHFVEPVALAELLADAQELLGRLIDEHGIRIVEDYGKLPLVETDRQRLLQVLVNLLKNAVQSIVETKQPHDGQLLIRLHQPRPYWVSIEISDNGIGIAKENLVKIFSHGFTTKQDGHGFGLHSCANIVRELGGTIYAYSDGAGTGAKFAVVLPVKHAESGE